MSSARPQGRPGPAAGWARHRRQGRQDRRPWHQGPGRPRHHPHGFEGGQLPLMQRIPKLRGFKNPFRIEYTPGECECARRPRGRLGRPGLTGGQRAGPQGCTGQDAGRRRADPGPPVEAHAFSKSAESAITGAGGSITVVPLPFGHTVRRLRATPSPTGSIGRTVRRRGASMLVQSGQHLPDPRPSQEGHVHADHHRPVPVRGQRSRPGSTSPRSRSSRRPPSRRACSASSTCSPAGR